MPEPQEVKRLEEEAAALAAEEEQVRRLEAEAAEAQRQVRTCPGVPAVVSLLLLFVCLSLYPFGLSSSVGLS